MGQEDRIVEVEDEGAPPEGQEALQDGRSENGRGTMYEHDLPEAPEGNPTGPPRDRGHRERGLAEDVAGALHQAGQDRPREGKNAHLDPALVQVGDPLLDPEALARGGTRRVRDEGGHGYRGHQGSS